MKRTLQIIETTRGTNTAYVAYVQDDPYESFNAFVRLDWIESLARCTFEDGDHPFVEINIDDLEVPYV
jgi:hypothetical protein